MSLNYKSVTVEYETERAKARELYHNGVEGLYREGEEIIARHGYWSYLYAFYKLKGRFRAGEEAIVEELFWKAYVEYLKKKGIEI